jgi:hypothetical protein
LPTLYSGRRTDGLVGTELLERYVVAFDSGARTMTACEPASFEYRGSGAVLPVERRMRLLGAPHAGPLVLTGSDSLR